MIGAVLANMASLVHTLITRPTVPCIKTSSHSVCSQSDRFFGSHRFTAAEAAVGAIYALHPEPHAFMEPILQHTAAAVFPRNSNPQHGAGPGDCESGQQQQQQRSRPPCMVSTQLLSRFVFLLGQVAIQHLVGGAKVSGAH